jgi:hypothetical protein
LLDKDAPVAGAQWWGDTRVEFEPGEVEASALFACAPASFTLETKSGG